MLTLHSSVRHSQSEYALKLIAETVGTAQLIERRASPHAARQGLIKQPAIEEQIHARVGGLHLHRAEHVVPPASGVAQRIVKIGRTKAIQQLKRFIAVLGLSKEEDNLGARARTELESGLERRAGIQASSYLL